MKPRVAFVCVHNSCRSQIAEALGRALADDVFESYSAGTALKAAINPDAVRLMKQLYGIDMEKDQHPKLLTDIPAVDVVITMGCGVTCPNLPASAGRTGGLKILPANRTRLLSRLFRQSNPIFWPCGRNWHAHNKCQRKHAFQKRRACFDFW